MKTLLFDLIAQRAAAQARIAEMTKKAANEASAFDRMLWAGMLRQYIDGMPSLDAQIERARASA